MVHSDVSTTGHESVVRRNLGTILDTVFTARSQGALKRGKTMPCRTAVVPVRSL